jgi:hypothetical protein
MFPYCLLCHMHKSERSVVNSGNTQVYREAVMSHEKPSLKLSAA